MLLLCLQGATGHLLGAAGAVEAIFTILALHHVRQQGPLLLEGRLLHAHGINHVLLSMWQGIIPPTLNLGNPDPHFSGNFTPTAVACERAISCAITNSFGFGGTNAALVLALPPT